MKILQILLIIFVVQEVPFKPKEEFEITLDYQFKQRPAADRATVQLDETNAEYERRNSTAMLPFLTLNIKILDNAGATRVRITNNLNKAVTNKKLKEGEITLIPLQIGYTDDVKDRVTAHEHIFTFINEERKELSRLVIFIDEDGSFLVNGEKRGRF